MKWIGNPRSTTAYSIKWTQLYIQFNQKKKKTSLTESPSRARIVPQFWWPSKTCYVRKVHFTFDHLNMDGWDCPSKLLNDSHHMRVIPLKRCSWIGQGNMTNNLVVRHDQWGPIAHALAKFAIRTTRMECKHTPSRPTHPSHWWKQS